MSAKQAIPVNSGIKNILVIGLFIKDRTGKGAYGYYLLLVDPGVLLHVVYQLVAKILPFKFFAYLGVLDDDFIRSRRCIDDFGEDVAIFFDKISAAGAFHFVLDKHRNFF